MNKASKEAAKYNSDAKGPAIRSDDTKAQKEAAAELYYYMHKEDVDKAVEADQLGAIQPDNVLMDTVMTFKALKGVVAALKGLSGMADDAVAVGKSVIGPRATYRQFAKAMGANFLDVTDAEWSWPKNLEYLKGIVSRGDDAIFAGKYNPKLLDPKSVLAKEINYLSKNGYEWVEDFSKMVKVK